MARDLSKLIDDVKLLEHMMLEFSTGKLRGDDDYLYHIKDNYTEVYYGVKNYLEYINIKNPNPFFSLDEFRAHYDGNEELSSYVSRRGYISKMYKPLIYNLKVLKNEKFGYRLYNKVDKLLVDDLSPVKVHWLKAKKFVESNPPDYENSIKESISALESLLKIMTDSKSSALGDLVNKLRGDLDDDIAAILKTIYGRVSNKSYVRHGGVDESNLGKQEAIFFIELSAAAMIYIKGKLK